MDMNCECTNFLGGGDNMGKRIENQGGADPLEMGDTSAPPSQFMYTRKLCACSSSPVNSVWLLRSVITSGLSLLLPFPILNLKIQSEI